MMKILKSLFTREPPEKPVDHWPSEVWNARDEASHHKAMERVLAKRAYKNLADAVDQVSSHRPDAERAEMLRNLAGGAEKAAARQAGVRSAQDRAAIQEGGGSLELHKPKWTEKYRQQAEARKAEHAEPPQQKPRGPRMKP